jgi:hypothetical protein
MAYPAENTQEGGTNAATVSTANSGGASGNAFNVISGTPVFDNTAGQVQGTMGMKFTVGGSLAALYVGWDSTTLTTAPLTVFGRCYWWSSIHPGSSVRLVEFMNGATVLGFLGVANTTSRLTWYNSANTAATANGLSPLSLSTLYRFEFQFNVATTTTGSATAKVFLGNSATTAGADSTATAQNYGTLGVNTVRFGNTGANFTINSSFWAGDLQLNTTGFPGPQGAGVAATKPAPARRPRAVPAVSGRGVFPMFGWRRGRCGLAVAERRLLRA